MLYLLETVFKNEVEFQDTDFNKDGADCIILS
jgi:hypothetical protein